MADDAVNRGLSAEQANPFLRMETLKYFGDEVRSRSREFYLDREQPVIIVFTRMLPQSFVCTLSTTMLRQDIRMVSAHDLRCLAGIDLRHISRYFIRWLEEGEDPPNTLTVDYLRVARPGEPPYTNNTALALGADGRFRTLSAKVEEETGKKSSMDSRQYVRPSVINAAIAMDLTCARDHKWRLVSMAIDRQECNCINQVRRGAGGCFAPLLYLILGPCPSYTDSNRFCTELR